jgi:hypothetical protein
VTLTELPALEEDLAQAAQVGQQTHATMIVSLRIMMHAPT